MPTLFDPLQMGELLLPNRILMAPLTRARAGSSRVPNELMARYYAQRASAGLILSEATVVTPLGVGYADTPGIWSVEQIAGWRIVTQAVHRAGGRIFCQLWHVGRISHPLLLDGATPVAPSAIAPPGNVSLLRPSTPYVTPRALALDEIPEIVEAFRRGAENAQAAGFDGVEIHGANGYLIDQFLQDSTNRRTDEYGGSVENRARLLLEIVAASCGVWGSARVGVHLSPRNESHYISDSNPTALFGYVASELGRRSIGFICVREPLRSDPLGPRLKQAFGGPYIANEKYTRETAEQLIESQRADAVAFGKLFIANPDLPRRFSTHARLNEPHSPTYYHGGTQGYIDYPSLEQAVEA